MRRVAGTIGCLALLALVAWAPAGRAETVQSEGIRIGFSGGLAPRSLPRDAPGAAIHLAVDARIGGADGAPLPRLRRIALGVTSAGRIDPAGLPVCHLSQLQPATTEQALAACGPARVGTGLFAAQVRLDEQAPYPSRGRIVAFNGRYHGRPAILLHVFGPEPVPTSYTLPLTISHSAGTFGTVLSTSIAAGTPSAGRITRLSLNIGRTFSYRGHPRAYLSAVCPAPPRVGSTRFPVLRTELGFAGRDLSFTVSRGCGVRG
jgi:hypothetical protein